MEQQLHTTTQITDQLASVLNGASPGFDIIESSLVESKGLLMGMLKAGSEKKLFVSSESGNGLFKNFTGNAYNEGNVHVVVGNLSEANAAALRTVLPWTAPILLGNSDSFGFGDRLGNASAAHLSSLENSTFRPIIAQQSIREMDRTQRTAQQVMDAASWAVFEIGYDKGFGSDADHLKTTADIDRTMKAGFTMYTIDPSDYVDNRVVEMSDAELNAAFEELPWDKLRDTPADFRNRFIGQTFELGNGVSLRPTEKDIICAAVKYGRVVLHTHDMFRYLRDVYADRPSEVELSVDETPHPTTPEEHLVVAAELQRMGVELVSLAPRFCGDFEKGIDFKGDLEAFKQEYLIHQAIAGTYGKYKLSVHSGSDKFQVYAAIGELNIGTVHVKTAGTSYLEALRAISMTNAPLFREIITFAGERFETDRKTYHISAELKHFPSEGSLSDDQLPDLLNDDNARQVFHVTFGSVLTTTDASGKRIYYDRFMSTLSDHADVYNNCLYKHFRKHLSPFE
jgi:tagaturonate epimerase